MVHKNIVVAVDESEEASFAFEYAVKNLYVKGECNFVVIHVDRSAKLDASLAMLSPGDMMVPIHTLDEPSAESKLVMKTFKDRADYLHIQNFHEKILVNTSGPGQSICNFVDSLEDPVLIVGSKHHSMIERAFLGSVGEHCVHHTRAPIYIVKAPHSVYKE